MKILAVASGKGGVGKSTITTQLASLLAHNGYKVGVIDADIYGPCQYGLLAATESEITVDNKNKIIPGYSEIHKIHYISVNNLLPDTDNSAMLWRAPIATKLIREFLQQVAWPELDFLFIDMPPGTGDIQITIAQLAKLDGAIIVTTPQKVAYNIAAKAINMFKKMNVKILGIIENMSGYICTNCNHQNHIFDQNNSHNGGKVLAEQYDTQLLGAIPLSHNLVNISDNGQSVINLEDNNPVKSSYLSIIQSLLLKLIDNDNQNSNNPTDAPQYQLISHNILEIKTSNNTKQHSAYDLRVSCQCAMCKDEFTGQERINKNIISKDIRITNIHEVGNYGLRLTFSDGHGTGIYKFNSL